MDRRTPPARTASGFSLLEVVVAVAVAVILGSMLVPVAFSWIDEGKAARAQGDAGAIGAAMNRFFQDTLKWPGQVEILETDSTIRFLRVGNPEGAEFPTLTETVGIGAATCADGLSGVIKNTTSFAAAVPSPSNSLDVNTFLVNPPPVADYPNWKGPYLSVDLRSDPWGAVYVINIIPLFCGEAVAASAPGGALGYAWILSGGPNRTIQTPFTGLRLSADSDDVGVPLSKRAVQSAAQ